MPWKQITHWAMAEQTTLVLRLRQTGEWLAAMHYEAQLYFTQCLTIHRAHFCFPINKIHTLMVLFYPTHHSESVRISLTLFNPFSTAVYLKIWMEGVSPVLILFHHCVLLPCCWPSVESTFRCRTIGNTICQERLWSLFNHGLWHCLLSMESILGQFIIWNY